MAPKRGSTMNNSTNALSPQDNLTSSNPSSPAFLGFPRSTSPSSNFTQFLSKPHKWFTRTPSGSKTSPVAAEPRTSTSSGRKHKISRPTDPRPILDAYGAGGASKSVLDLSSHGHPSHDLPPFHPPSVPSSPMTSHNQGSFGDLRNVSRKGWSKSVDDLGKVSTGSFSPINTSFQEKILEYRNRSDSNASAMSPSSPTSTASIVTSRHPFPTAISDSQSSSPPRSSTLPSVSISAPAHGDNHGSQARLAACGPASPGVPGAPTHVHTRSHSFTPKLPSKLAPRFGPTVPNRKGSTASEKDVFEFKEHQYAHGNSNQTSTTPSPVATRGAFGFPFGGLSSSKSSTTSAAAETQQGNRNTGAYLLTPPTIIEPSVEESGEVNGDILNADDMGISKRSSQIVYHSGLINRLADLPVGQHTFSLAKGWKPFRMELKGSKLYFFKPPSDRGAAIKELFPTELVPPSPGDEDEELECTGDEREGGDPNKLGVGRGKGKVREDAGAAAAGRKKRAFWGRRTHPDLVITSGVVEKGTFEALVHEAVFGTIFMKDFAVAGDSAEEENDDMEHQDTSADANHHDRDLQWKDFAAGILMCFPSLVGQLKFENEFIRCCDYLVNGADGSGKDRVRGRVGWLAGEYLKYHGVPADLKGWEKWRRETIPDVPAAIVHPSHSVGVPAPGQMKPSISNQAVYAPSPSPSSPGMFDSPHIGTFSPRPEDSTRLLSLVDALKPTPAEHGGQRAEHVQHGHPHPHANPGPAFTKMAWIALDQEGLSRDVLSILDPYLVSKSLTVFNRLVLEQLPTNLTLDMVISPGASTSDQQVSTPDSQSHYPSPSNASSTSPSALTLLFGNDEQPHWLTKLVLLSILGADTSSGILNNFANIANNINTTGPSGHPGTISTGSSGPIHASSSGGGSGNHPSAGAPGGTQPFVNQITTHQQVSRTHSRSEVISVWIKIAELCRSAGDECSWKAIAAALCARPVARLEKVWKRVDPLALAAIEGWIHPPSGSSASGEGEGQVYGALYQQDGTAMLAGVKVDEPKIVPWGGDIKNLIQSELNKAKGEGNEQQQFVYTAPLEKARIIFESFRTGFALCPRRSRFGDGFGLGLGVGGGATGGNADENGHAFGHGHISRSVIGEVEEDVQRLLAYWRKMAANGGGIGGMASKFNRVDQFTSLSFAAEPRRKGLFEPYYWSRSTSNSAPYSSLLPLLFPEALPTTCLVDRAQLLRGRADSESSEITLFRNVGGTMDSQNGRRQLERSDQNTNSVVSLLGRTHTLIPVFNGDLLLVVEAGGMEVSGASRPPSSRAPSRPPSSVNDVDGKPLGRNQSIRVKPGSSQGLDRKTSVARRSSLPSVSNKQNFIVTELSSEPPLRVIVQAGTLNRLVEILVHGLRNVSVSVADDNGEMSLREGMTRELVVDHVEFANVWWNVFRSFVTPLVFFELLRKLYITSQPSAATPTTAEYILVTGKRSEVLGTIKEWIMVGGGAQDILDDSALFDVVRSFLESQSDHNIFQQSASWGDPAVKQAWDALTHQREALKGIFVSHTLRAPISRAQPRPREKANGSAIQGANAAARRKQLASREMPDIDQIDPEELVDSLDGMAAAAFSNVTDEDLFTTADILEVQSADKTGWFSSREPGTLEETVEIQTVYTHIQEVEPTTMISEMSQDAVYRLLPPSIRSCIRAYGIVRRWLIAAIVAPKMGLRARQQRIEVLLQAIEIARLRNAEGPSATTGQQLAAFEDSADPSSPVKAGETPIVRSFVEAVISSAILSVESRLHHRAWQNVAFNRGAQYDTLAMLLARPFVQQPVIRTPLTIDIGWLLERLLEVIATPDIVDSIAFEGQNLVNFDKRRHLYRLVTKGPMLPTLRRPAYSDEITRRGFERLNSMEKEAVSTQFDLRGIKEEAVREAMRSDSNTVSSTKKLVRPFQRLVILQLEKNRRDRNLRSRMQKEKLQEQTKNEKRDDMLTKAMRPRKPGSQPVKQHRNKKSMSAFLHFMRPISSAFGADIIPASGHKRSASELDFRPTGKPFSVLSLMDARVSQFINNERSFTFNLDTEDGGHYLLQAMNRKDMVKWINTLNRVTKMAAKRRLTYLGNSPKPQLADHLHDHPKSASRDPNAVFGVELDVLLRREAEGQEVLPGTIPSVIDRCLAEIESRGLTEVGIYRIAGAVSVIQSLKDDFNRGGFPIELDTDIHAVCDVVKSWFRVLPESVFPPTSYHAIIKAMQLNNLDDRLASIRAVIQSLPQANFDLLKRVTEHLDRVTDFEEHNHMTAEALAIVFSPNLLRAPQNDFAMILANMGHTHRLVKTLITHFHSIFDEGDPEADVQSEEEYDGPIPEEDEEDEDLAPMSSQTLEPYSSEDGRPYTPI